MINLDYDVDLSEGVITFKNVNTTLGFVGIMRQPKWSIFLLTPCLDVKDLLKNY
jgi:hypothetical protein